ncbi:MAG TPA: hypothetical protein VFE13_06125 [Caulobacteraceae bacterium]|nr:hypothetical protein [Caulobacteraceae bacterium]
MLDGDGAAFKGQVLIGGGTVELATSGALGAGKVVFGSGTVSQTLVIDAPAAPSAGGSFANLLSNFADKHDAIDLTGLAFAPGATATASGTALVLDDGGQTFKFRLAGAVGSAFAVSDDGHGGTLVKVKVAGLAQAAAALPKPGAGATAPGSRDPAGRAIPFVQATGSAGGRA